MDFQATCYRLLRSRLGRSLGLPAIILLAGLVLFGVRASSKRRGSPGPTSKPATHPAQVPDQAVATAIANAKAFLGKLSAENQWEAAPAPVPALRGGEAVAGPEGAARV